MSKQNLQKNKCNATSKLKPLIAATRVSSSTERRVKLLNPLVKNYISRTSKKTRFRSYEFRSIFSDLIFSSQARLKYKSSKNVMVLVTKKRAEDAFKARWYRFARKMSKPVRTATSKLLPYNSYGYRWRFRLFRKHYTVKPSLKQFKSTKSKVFFAPNKKRKRSLNSLLGASRRFTWASVFVNSANSNGFLANTRYYSTKFQPDVLHNKANFLPFYQRRARWFAIVRRLRTYKHTYFSSHYVRKLHKFYTKRRRNKKSYKKAFYKHCHFQQVIKKRLYKDRKLQQVIKKRFYAKSLLTKRFSKLAASLFRCKVLTYLSKSKTVCRPRRLKRSLRLHRSRLPKRLTRRFKSWTHVIRLKRKYRRNVNLLKAKSWNSRLYCIKNLNKNQFFLQNLRSVYSKTILSSSAGTNSVESKSIPTKTISFKTVRLELMRLRLKNKRFCLQQLNLSSFLKKYYFKKNLVKNKLLPNFNNFFKTGKKLHNAYTAVRHVLKANRNFKLKNSTSLVWNSKLSTPRSPGLKTAIKFFLPKLITRKNKIYTRVYLRRRVRASALLKRRARLKRPVPLRWPTAYELGRRRPRYSRRSHWRRRRFFDKKHLTRVSFSRVLNRSLEKLKVIPKINTSVYASMHAHKAQLRRFLKKLPKHTPIYRLLFRRWHSYRDNLGIPLPRIWPSRAEIRRLAYTNRLRHKRGLKPKKHPDPVFYELEVGAGSTTSLGYRRRRRVFQSNFNTTRWWKPTAFVSPVTTALSSLSLRYPDKFNFFNTKNNSKSLSSAITFRKHIKRFGFRPISSENKHLLAKIIREKNGWRTISSTMSNNDMFCTFSWSLNKLHKIISHLSSTSFSGIWTRCTTLLGFSAALRLRSIFTKQSKFWLEERYSERKLTSKLSLLNTKLSPSATKNLTILNRKKLFQRSPLWWVEETSRRLHALDFVLNNLKLSGFKNFVINNVADLLQTAVTGYNAIYSVQLANQEKKLLSFTLAQLSVHEKEALLKNFIYNNKEYVPITSKSASSSYQFWLRGIESHMKKIVQSASGLDHNELHKPVITLLGNDRARFPGIGRRPNSYDRTLRLFYKKTAPSRFRRVQNYRFRLFRPLMNKTFYTRSSRFESTLAQRQNKRLLQPLLRSRYLTRSWRRLLNRRNTRRLINISKNSNTVSISNYTVTSAIKRRFQKLPLELCLDTVVSKKSEFNFEKNSSLDTLMEPLLLSAIKARLKTRRLQDLALHVNRRLLPFEQILPPWMTANKLRKQRKGAGAPEYFLPNRYDASTETRWALRDFSLAVSKNRPNRVFKSTAVGETLFEPSLIFRRPGFQKGFSLARGKRKIRRFRKRRRYRGVLLKKKRKFRSRKLLRRSKRYKKRSLFSFRVVKRVVLNRLLTRRAVANRSFAQHLVNTLYTSFLPTPLQFSKPTQDVSISEIEKKRQKAGLEVLKQGHYKKVSQLTNTLTTFFPQLISLILSRQGFTSTLNKKIIKNTIHSIYWSLRFYLQNDFAGFRLNARDKSRVRFNLLRNQTFRDAENLYFGSSEFKLMRQRFQPYHIHSIRSFRRNAIDWLRMFFPRYHSLYLEDSEEYRNFFLTPFQVMRAHPSRKSPGQWSSHNLAGSMENKFKRLTNNSSLENSSRFENALMTTRRSPITPGRGSAASMRFGSNFSSHLMPKSSFFRRHYSTISAKTASLKLVTDRALKVQHQSAEQNTSLSDYKALSLKHLLKARTYAKGQSRYATAGGNIGAGSTDPRFTRMKSPRNRQFLQRLNGTTSNKATTLRRQYLKNILQLDISKKNNKVYVNNRKTVTSATSVWGKTWSSTIRKCRVEGSWRRAPNFLKIRLIGVKKGQLHPRRFLFSNKYLAKKYTKSQRPEITKTVPEILISSSRSILQFRKASYRSVFSTFNKSLLPRRNSIVLRPSVSRFLQSYGLHNSLAKRILRWRSRNFTGWFRKKSSILAALNLTNRQKSVRLMFHSGNSKANFSSGILLFKRKNNRLKYLVKRSTRIFSNTKVKSNNAFFISQSKLLQKNNKLTNKFLVDEERRMLLNPGSVRRQELWDQITLPWMKKHRVLKNWLKTAKRALKKSKWDQMPELLFKGMRVRLRKLEWREPDGHFNRRGWRNAFKLFPNERKKAPWLERLIYRRSLYSTIRGPYRRYQFPREQKRLKWLQQYRAVVLARRHKKYIKGRRWPKLRIYNQRLHRSLFSLRNKRVAQRHFKKLSRRKPAKSGFSKSLLGLADRLDVNLVLLNIAPTIFWAKVLAVFGVFRINNSVVCDPAYRFKQNDRIFWNWTLIERLREHFQRPLRHYELARNKNTSANFPKNFDYFPAIRTAIYRGLPRAKDFQKNSRLTPFLFRMFQADSGSGK